MASACSSAASHPTASPPYAAVRVEGGDSIGRSYAADEPSVGGPGGGSSALVPGLGATRRALRSTAWRDAYWGPSSAEATAPCLESYTLALTHLSNASRDDVR